MRRQPRLSCPPKPVDTRYLLQLVREGGLSGVMTECRREDGQTLVARQGKPIRKEKRGNGARQSAHA